MTKQEQFQAPEDVTAEQRESAGHSEMMQSALARYVHAISGSASPESLADSATHDPARWNFENVLVRDVMTRIVISVHENAPFKEIVDALANRRVSAVPVIDSESKVVGIVSESDLLAKVVTAGNPSVRLHGHSTKVLVRRKSQAETARELMTTPVVKIRPDSSVVHAARVAAIKHVRRLPVVEADGKLVGIVTRSDLLRVFLRADEAIRAHAADLFASKSSVDTSEIEIIVHHGIVTLKGKAERRRLVEPIVDALRTTAGVVGVHDQLSYRIEDPVAPMPEPRPYY